MVLGDGCFELEVFFNCRNVVLTFPIRAFTLAADPPNLSTIVSRSVKLSTSSRTSPSSVIVLVQSVVYYRISLLPLCVLVPTVVEAAATLFVFTCICCCV
ncbi:unnamed protein product [Schistosoma rodhaini]|nr:unnamed protein product [Schistosoma rodhaini]